MKQRSFVVARFSARLYRIMLIAYPARFRRNYGPHMLQVFRDSCRDAERRRGAWGVYRLWLPTLWDLMTTVWSERIAEGVNMSSLQWQRLGSLAALTTGAFLIMPLVLPYIAPFLGTDDPRIEIPVFIMYAVLPIGATMALQARLRPDLGRLGWIVGAVVLLSMSVSSLSELVFYWQFALRMPPTLVMANVAYVSSLFYIICALLYGLLALKSHLGPIRNILPLCLYTIYALGLLGSKLMASMQVINPSATLFLYTTMLPISLGIGWIAIGIFLWLGHRQPERQASPAFSPQA
jgi:hypothetical protein